MKFLLNCNATKMVMLILSIITITIFLIKRSYKKYIILIIIVVYVNGVIIYYFGYIGDTVWNSISISSISLFVRSLFSAAAMFSFNNSFSDISNSLQANNIYSFYFWYIHFLAMFSMVITLIYLLGDKMKNTVKLIFAIFVKKYIVLGINEYSIAFIKSLEKTQSKDRFVIVIIDDGAISTLREQANKLNVAILQGDIDDPMIIKRAGLRRSIFNKDIYILALGNDEIKNIDSVGTIQESILASDSVQKRLFFQPKCLFKDRVHIIVNSTNNEWINYIDREDIIDLKIFSKADIMARQFVDLCPSYSLIQIDTDNARAISDYTIFIIGFGETGQQVLLKMISVSQYETSKFKAIVIDGNMNNLKGKFQRKYSELINNYNIQFEHADIGSDTFNLLLQDNIANVNCVVICLQQDQKNMELAFEIKRLTEKYNILSSAIQIVVKCNCKSIFGKKIKEGKLSGENITFFGELEEIFTEDIIINEKLDDLAKAINEYYNINNPKYSTPWNKLSNFLRDANRHPAMHIKSKLNLVGLQAFNVSQVPEGACVLDTKEKFLNYLGEIRLATLAHMEHLRWNAFYFASGWNVLPLDQATKWKDNKKKLHTCLVSWDELDKVSDKFGQNYKIKDFEQIENIVEYLKRIDYVIVVSK